MLPTHLPAPPTDTYSTLSIIRPQESAAALRRRCPIVFSVTFSLLYMYSKHGESQVTVIVQTFNYEFSFVG